jgi:uncharacterized protein with FMN-binding domain
MRRVVITTVSTVAGVVALLGLKPHVQATLTPAADPTAAGSASGSSSSSSSRSSATTTAAPQIFTGEAISTRFGPVQVEVTVTDGRITDVQVLQYPHSDRRDAEINGYALPLLVQATLDANSANVDMVSGATYTSNGYVRSLQSALDQAGW